MQTNHANLVQKLLLISLLSLFLGPSAQAEEVSREFNGLTLNGHLEMAEGKGYGDGMVLILHGVMGHNRMEIIESAQQFLLDNDQSSLAINLSLGIDNRHGFYNCDVPSRHLMEDSIDELQVLICTQN